MALFTLNFLNLDAQGHTAAERHCIEPDRPKEMVKWKDVLTGKWKGPDPILIRSRGAVCVFPQEDENPFWVPERLIRKIFEYEKSMLPRSTVDHHDEDVDKPEDGNRDTMVGNYDNLPNSHAGDQ